MSDDPRWQLVAVFVPFSLIAIGGATSIFAGIQHEAVNVRGWVSAREFVDLFALARGAPGPGSMLVTLIGWKVAGWSGAFIATLAIFVPASVLCYALARAWTAYRGTRLHRALEMGLAPIGTGLLLAGLIAIFRVAEAGALSWIVAGLSAATFVAWPRMPPLLLLAAGGLIFWMGYARSAL